MFFVRKWIIKTKIISSKTWNIQVQWSVLRTLFLWYTAEYNQQRFVEKLFIYPAVRYAKRKSENFTQ